MIIEHFCAFHSFNKDQEHVYDELILCLLLWMQQLRGFTLMAVNKLLSCYCYQFEALSGKVNALGF